jgi:ankyrin repeat protein
VSPTAFAFIDGDFILTAALRGNNRGRTALHFAAEANHDKIVALLLQHHADARTTSDGRWTALHNAAERGNEAIVSLLLESDADINAQLDNGMTALHYASQNGHVKVVEILLSRRETELGLKDSSHRTAMLCAAEKGHQEIVTMLAPERNGHRLPLNALHASQNFRATIVDFGINEKPHLQRRIASSMYDLLYGWDEINEKPKVPTQIKNIKIKPAFRWIHIPSNNLAWVDALLTKVFIESGHREVEDFKTLEKIFSQEHRGPFVHASFMRTYCQRIPPTNLRSPILPEVIQDETVAGSNSTPAIQVSPATPMIGSIATLPDKENSPNSSKKKSKGDKFEKRQVKKTPVQSPKANTGGKAGKQPEKNGTKPPSKLAPSGKVVLFVSV